MCERHGAGGDGQYYDTQRLLWGAGVGHRQASDGPHPVGMNEGRGPGNGRAPVVADDHRWLVRAQGGDQASHISREMFEAIGLDLMGLVRTAVSANADRQSAEAGG